MEKTIHDFLDMIPVGGSIDVYQLTNRLAFEVVINSLFNIAIPDGSKKELARIIRDVQKFIVKDIRQPLKYFWFVLSGTVKDNLSKSARSREIIKNIIQQRKENNQ